MEQELSCSVCRELFTDPVILCCSHSFCKVCLETWWEGKEIKTCPFCKRRCKRYTNGPPLNLSLKNAVEAYKQRVLEHPECSRHCEKLKLFCLNHEEPACVICRDSSAHTGHRFRPIEEAAPDLRAELRSFLEPLQSKLKVLNERRVQFDNTAAHISAQAKQTREQIRKQFQEQHLFLWKEEQSRMKALKEEEEQKTKRMKDQMDAVSKDIETLSQTLSKMEEQLRAADASFLLQYKAAVDKVDSCLMVQEPKMEPGALINQTKHLSKLRFNVWKKMKSQVQYYSVLLDPNTAAPDLIISEDLTSVRVGERQKVPANPERSFYEKTIRGSRRFVSGTHKFDVDVSGNKEWQVEVSGERKSICICFSNNKYTAISLPGLQKDLSVKNLQRIRVKLDCNRKTVTFADADTNLVLHTETDTSFEKVVPFFSIDTSLKILPKVISQVVFNGAFQPAQCSENTPLVPVNRPPPIYQPADNISHKSGSCFSQS